MLVFLVCGLPLLFAAVFLVIRVWTTRKQAELSAEEFRFWFMRNYVGIERPDAASTQIPDETRKKVITTSTAGR